MGKIMRGSASLALVLLMAISTVIPVSAASSVGEQAFKSGERVIQIAIPDQNGELQIYKGNEAHHLRLSP